MSRMANVTNERVGKEQFQIRMLGSLRVTGPYGQVKWRTVKSGELFAYLYLHRTVAVDRILDEVFLDGKTDNPKGYLHTTIYQLRKSLAASGLSESVVISCDQGSYRLEVQNLESDIEAFERAASRTASDQETLWEAVGLYGGGLLEGVESLWVIERRERYRRQVMGMGSRLAGLLETQGAVRHALEVVQKLHRHDPGNGSLAFHVARLYQQLGHRGLADDYVERYLLRYREEWGFEAERPRLVYSG